LQVEHPVTEMVTGLDLVEWQLRVACGEPLPLRQEQLAIHGHALEARIYAEDPDKGFLPSTGRLLHLVPPVASPHVRIDTGVEQGDTITPHYDPMIAKLIVWGTDRPQALARMRVALAQYQVVGVQNNIGFLGRLVASPSFTHADLDTGLIEREAERLFPTNAGVPDDVWLMAALAELLREARLSQQAAQKAMDPDSPWRALDSWRMNGPTLRSVALRLGDTEHDIGVENLASQASGREYALWLKGQRTVAYGSMDLHGNLQAHVGKRHMHATVVAHGQRRQVFFAGQSWPLALACVADTHGTNEAEGSLQAPMPGKVIALLVAVGTTVDQGTPLLVMEAMKMEHTITAPCKGEVTAFHFSLGEQVAEGVDVAAFAPLAAPKQTP
jgi:3-methylcrotonyl-CoA carboxylase alpha subunit